MSASDPPDANAVRAAVADPQAEIMRLRQDLVTVTADRNRLAVLVTGYQELINSPVTADFLDGVTVEAAHQRLRWDDSGKNAVDWLGVVTWLAGKAARAMAERDLDKALHHTISTAALCGNWHTHLSAALPVEPPGEEAGPGDG